MLRVAVNEPEEAQHERLLHSLDSKRLPVRSLTLSHIQQQDARCAALLRLLRERGFWLSLREEGDDDRVRGYHAFLEQLRTRKEVRAANEEPPPPWALWTLDLSSNQLTSFEASGLTACVYANGSLRELEIQANQIPAEVDADARAREIAAFAHAVGNSNLRRLNLAFNRLGMPGLCVFFDTLRHTGCVLQTLSVSMNAHGDPVDDAECMAAAQSIARFLAQRDACKTLRELMLSALPFHWEAVRTIVHAILGSRVACTADGSAAPAEVLDAQPPNQTLTRIDLFASEPTRSSTVPVDVDAPWEHASRLQRPKYYDVLKKHLDVNSSDRAICRFQAARLLGAARTIGCRAREGAGAEPGVFPLLRLPPELRAHVLRMLDDDGALSEAQFISVLSWACEPSTIGYGSSSWPGLPQEPEPPATEHTTLPAPPWSWDECFCRRSPPRDWNSDWCAAHEEGPEHPHWRRPMRSLREAPAPLLAFWECTGTDAADGAYAIYPEEDRFFETRAMVPYSNPGVL